ncbi:MAG: type VI secretion system tip protein TssI/VgrG [Pseudomonadota bacterium]
MTSEFRETLLTIDLGGEQVEFVSMQAYEALAEEFDLDLQIVATLKELDLVPHLGEPVALALYENEELVRHFHGILTEATYLTEDGDGFHYNLKLKPFTHFMDGERGFAIYQEKTVIDIIKEVFDRAKVSDYELRTAASYETFEYCVQYAESDFNFISRLMEQEGLYYWFEHSEDKHLMVISDKASKHTAGSVADLAFNAAAGTAQSYRTGEGLGSKHVLEEWTERVASTGQMRVSLRDYDFKKPTKAVDGTATDKSQHPSDQKEHYDYPGQFIDKGRADRLSEVRLEEFRALRQTYAGVTAAKGMTAGATFKLDNHPTDRMNIEYMVISTSHIMRSQSYHSGTGNRDADIVNFVAIPAKTQFRAQRRTPKPRVVGVESAIVTGPTNETIYTDEYGRIKVRFHWDRSGSDDDKSTCWIRVSQTGGLGNVILPRVGHEVLVDFLHGDPDQPVVTGRVFNKEHMPVYELPANKSRALWRTLTYGEKAKSYPGAEELDTKAPFANEIRFEDKADSEEILVHAEKDMNVRVRFDTSTHIGHNEELKVGWDRQRYVKNDEKVEIDGSREYTLKKNEKNTITEGNRETTIKMGNDDLTVSQGNITVEASLGKIKIEAMQEIQLKVGMTTLTLKPTEATLKSLMTNIKADVMGEVSAGAVLTEKGALIKIN